MLLTLFSNVGLRSRRGLLGVLLVMLSLVLTACGGSSDSPSASQAQQSQLTVGDSVPGVTPFIRFVTLSGIGIEKVRSVGYSIDGKPGSVSKPVSVNYSKAYLTRRGYASSVTPLLTVPVFGLYANYTKEGLNKSANHAVRRCV